MIVFDHWIERRDPMISAGAPAPGPRDREELRVPGSPQPYARRVRGSWRDYLVEPRDDDRDGGGGCLDLLLVRRDGEEDEVEDEEDEDEEDDDSYDSHDDSYDDVCSCCSLCLSRGRRAPWSSRSSSSQRSSRSASSTASSASSASLSRAATTMATAATPSAPPPPPSFRPHRAPAPAAAPPVFEPSMRGSCACLRCQKRRYSLDFFKSSDFRRGIPSPNVYMIDERACKMVDDYIHDRDLQIGHRPANVVQKQKLNFVTWEPYFCVLLQDEQTLTAYRSEELSIFPGTALRTITHAFKMKVKRSVMNGIPYAYGYHHVPIEPLMADNYERFAESQSDATAYSAYQPAAKSFWSSSQLSGPSYAFQKPVAAPENRVNSDVVYRTLMQRAAGRGASAETAQDRGNGNVAIQLTANVVYDYERPTVHHQSMTGYQPSDVAEPRDMLYDEAAKVAAGRKSAMFFTEDIAGVAPFLIVALASGESSEEKNTATGATTAATPAPTAAAPNVFRTLFDEYYDAEAKTADMDRNTYTVITDDEAKTGDLPTTNDDFLVIVDNGESSESTTPAADEVNSASDSSESSDSEPATTAEPNYDEATLVNGLDLMVMVIDEKRQYDQAYDTETNNIAGRSTDNEIVSISSEEITTQSPATAALDVEEHDGHLSDEENAWERAIYVAHQTEAPDAEEDDNMVVTTTEGEPDEILAELRRRLLDQYPSLNAPEETTTPEEEPTTPSTESEQDTTSSSVDVDAGESVFEEDEDWER